MTNLPSYIQNKQPGTGLAQRGLALVGTGAGPYMSIEGGRFTLIDAAGNTKPYETTYADVVIVDMNDHMSKDYRRDEWDPNNPTPPVCFSDNGVAPSVGSAEPQAPTCAGCQWNVWGSKISRMGSKVKACRDTMKTAIVVPGLPGNMFRLIVPPNSISNFRAYLAKFQNAGFDLFDVVTRLTFEQGVQGTLVFGPAPNPWLDDATLDIRNKAVASRASDMLVGRTDRPRLTAGEQPRPLPAPSAGEQTATPGFAPQGQLSGTPTPQATPTPPSQAFATGASPSEPTPRRRRTRAQIEADNAAAAGGIAGQPTRQAPAAGEPAMAPFRPAPPPNGGQAPAPAAGGQAGAFGIQGGVAPNPELAKSIADIFGT